MKAAVLHAPKQLSIETVPDPKCDDDEVLLKVHRSAICNSTDTHIWQGTFHPAATPSYPHILGHESCGEVIEVGKNFRNEYRIGDKVAYWVKMTGAFAEYNTIKPNKLGVCKLDQKIGYDEGAVLELVLGTLRLIYDSGLHIGDKVLLLGLGPAGQLLAQESRIAGASEIYCLDLYENRLSQAKKLGADYIFNLAGKQHNDVLDVLKRELGEIDIVIDAMGNNRWKNGNSVNLALTLLKRHGRYIIFGHRRSDVIDTYLVSNEDIIMRGFEPGLDQTKKLADFAVNMISSGRIKVRELITHHFPLHELERGLLKCRDDLHETIKVVIDII